MLFKNLKRYAAYFACLALLSGILLPSVLGSAAESADTLITSFEEAEGAEGLREKGIINYSHDVSVNTDKSYVYDGNNSVFVRPKNEDGTDYNTQLTVNFGESVKNAFGITFKIYNADPSTSAQVRCMLISDSGIKYQYVFTAAPSAEWQTVTVDFENIGLFGGEEATGGTSNGNIIKYSDIAGLTGIRIRMPYLGKEHSGVYFDDFRYIYEEESDDIITAERTLVSFDECETGENPVLPEGVSLISGSYGGTASIAEDQDGNKLYTVSMDKSVKNTATAAMVTGRKFIALSVAVPSKYAKYLDSIGVDIKNNIKKESSPKKKSYYIVGITDLDGNYGKTAGGAEELAYNADGVITKNTADMRRIPAQSSFLGNTGTKEKWNKRQFAEIKQILIYITLPDCTGKEGYSVSIGDITVSLKGDRQVIESIDEINKDLASFDEYDSLEKLASMGDFTLNGGNGKVKFTLTDDAQTAPNALHFKSEQDGVDYESSFQIKLENRAAGCAGIEFYVKNLDATESAGLRCFLVSKNAKYQYLKDIFPSENGEFTRVRILFNNVGAGGDEFWGGVSEGSSMTAKEIEELTAFRIRIPYLKSEHAGVIFDSFRLLTEEDLPKPEDLVRRMLDFDDCEVGGELPENVTLTDKYGGSMGVVEKNNGGKAFRINYDLETEFSTANKIGERKYVGLQITVPKTSLAGASEIRVGVTNNAVSDDGTWSGSSNIYQVVGIRGGGYYGKVDENAGKVPDVGEHSEIKAVLDKMRRTEGGLTGWTGSSTYWTKSQFSDVASILVYITAPTCDGTEGWSFDIDYIDVYYEDAAQNYETETRCAVRANRISGEPNGYITAEQVKIGRKDPNYTMFSTAWQFNINANEQPQAIKLLNTYTNYYTDLSRFTDSATLGFYLKSDIPLTLQLTLQDKAGVELKLTVDTVPPENSEQYGTYQMALADILSEYFAENPDGAFDVSDIRSVSVLPVSEGSLPETVMLSGLSIWTKEIGSAVSYSGYHYSDNGVTVDAYNDYLPMDTVTVIESEPPENAVKNFDIKFPKGLSAISFKTVTLYSAAGSVTEPSGKIWLGFEVDSNSDFSEISLYKVFFDGSYIKQRYAVEDGYIMLNTFTTGSFMIVKGKEVKKDNSSEDSGKNTLLPEPAADDGLITADNGNTDNAGGGTTTVKKKIITKVVRKKASPKDTFPVWAAVLIAAGAVAIVGGGAVTAVILVKRRKRGGKTE